MKNKSTEKSRIQLGFEPKTFWILVIIIIYECLLSLTVRNIKPPHAKFIVAHFEMEKSFYLHTGQHKQCNYSNAISGTIHSGSWWIVLQFSPSLHKLGKFTGPLVSKTGGRGSPGNKASCFLHFMYMWRVCLLCESYLTKYPVPGVSVSLLCLNFAHYVFLNSMKFGLLCLCSSYSSAQFET